MKEEIESIDSLMHELHIIDINSTIDQMDSYSDKDFKLLAIAVSKELKKRKTNGKENSKTT